MTQSSLSLTLPGVWTWIDLTSEMVDDALARLPVPSEVDLLGFATRAYIARESGVHYLGLCTNLGGGSVDVQIELVSTTVVPRENGEQRDPLEATAWVHRFYLGLDPDPGDLISGPNGLPTLRSIVEDQNTVTYVCSSPDDASPFIVRFRSYASDWPPELPTIGDAIVRLSVWAPIPDAD